MKTKGLVQMGLATAMWLGASAAMATPAVPSINNAVNSIQYHQFDRSWHDGDREGVTIRFGGGDRWDDRWDRRRDRWDDRWDRRRDRDAVDVFSDVVRVIERNDRRKDSVRCKASIGGMLIWGRHYHGTGACTVNVNGRRVQVYDNWFKVR